MHLKSLFEMSSSNMQEQLKAINDFPLDNQSDLVIREAAEETDDQ